MKIGLVAGGGDLPHHVIRGSKLAGHEVQTVTINTFSNVADFPDEPQAVGIAELGRLIKIFKKSNCTHVCFAGYITRPNFRTLKPDLKALRLMPGAILAARHGDTALLEYVLSAFEDEGFTVIPPQDLCTKLLLGEGHLGDLRMSSNHMPDAQKACEVASQMAALDIGQGAVVCRGLVLAVEAQEGTDSLLVRVAGLSEKVRGTVAKPEGVLAKMLAPDAKGRVDLPTIGVETVRLAQAAGLAGIVAESGKAFIIDKDAVSKAANAANLFIAGLPPAKTET